MADLILAILSPTARRQLAGLVGLMVVAAGVELAGLLSIYPFASAAIDPRVIHSTPWLEWLYRHLGCTTDTGFLIVLALGSTLAFLAGNSADALTHWLIYRFAFRERHRLSTAILGRYLARPFVWLRQQHSAELTENVLAAVDDTVVSIIVRGANTLARGLVSAFIVAALLWLQPVAALTAALALGGLYKLVYALVRQATARRGQEREEHRRERHKALLGALLAVKEARALPRRHHLVERFAEHSRRVNELEADLELVSEFPYVAIQTGAFASILTVATLLLAGGRSPAAVFPMVGVYALATLRLVPALEHVYTFVVRARFHLPSLELVHRELASPAPGPPGEERLPLRSEVRLEAVSFRYPGAAAPAVRDVSLRIPRGTSLALVGPTGSGKTTLADLFSGLLRPDSGQLLVDGEPVGDEQAEAWQRNLGYVPQEVCLLDDTLRRNIALGVPDEQIDSQALERAVRAANLQALVAELPEGYETRLGERGVCLSGGQRQRVGIARALYHDPELILFDEATSALDNATEAAVLEAVRELAAQGRTLLVVAHRLSTVRECTALALIEGGRVTARGSYAELAAESATFRELARLA